MSSHPLLPVQFHSDTIYCVEIDGEPFTPVKPIIENLGLAWQVQARKLVNNKERWGVTMMVIPSEGGEQQTLCMPVRKLTAFLAGINPSKVRSELRAKIKLYQEECDEVLWQYWAHGRAERQPALPPSRPQDARATYADMKHLRDLVRQWENVTGRMRRTIVRQYEAWLKTPTSRFTLDDVANAMLFVQARLDAIASEEAARRSAARELPPAREKEEAPVSVPGIQEDFLEFQREAGRLITGAYELVLAASEYRRAMKREERSGMDAAVTEKLISACMAQAACMGQNIESLSRMLAILI